MVDPENIQYPMHEAELQEFLLFAVCVGGHSAHPTARSLDACLRALGWPSEHKLPFDAIKHHAFLHRNLEVVLKMSGIGCYTARAKTFRHLAYSNIDVFNCTVEELENVWGIGPKTSRFFVMYSRPDEADDYAVLDVHILRWMREHCGTLAPKQTPSSTEKYKELEKEFISVASACGMTTRELDEYIWKGART